MLPAFPRTGRLPQSVRQENRFRFKERFARIGVRAPFFLLSSSYALGRRRTRNFSPVCALVCRAARLSHRPIARQIHAVQRTVKRTLSNRAAPPSFQSPAVKRTKKISGTSVSGCSANFFFPAPCYLPSSFEFHCMRPKLLPFTHRLPYSHSVFLAASADANGPGIVETPRCSPR